MLFIVVINYNFISKNKQKYFLEHKIVPYTGKFLHHFIFDKFCEFCDILPCHAYYVPVWIIHKNIIHEIIEIAIFVKI